MATLKPRPSDWVRSKEPEERLSLRRLKKRETDRRCQREARERTKSRIAYLEGLVDDLKQREAATAQKLRETEAEKDRMARILDVLRAALATHGHGLLEFHGQGLLESTAITSCEVDVSQPVLPQNSTIPVFASNLGEANSGQVHQCGMPVFAEPGQIESLQSNRTSDRPQSLNDESLTNTCSCDTHINSSNGQPPTWQGNFWRFACEVLDQRFDWPQDLEPASDLETDDIPIRALLHGWDAVKQAHLHLHPSWEILSRIDQFLFPSMPKPERLAMLKAMHSLLQFNLDPSLERFLRLPPWYNYRPSQGLPHSYAIDFFAWPGFRERFIFSQHAYCGNDFWYLYQNNMRLLWPHDFADCFTLDAQAGVFETTPTFNDRLRDINCWTMTPDFFIRFPELLGEIPISRSIPPSLSVGSRRVPSQSRLLLAAPAAPELSAGGDVSEGDKPENALSWDETGHTHTLALDSSFMWPQAQQPDSPGFMNWLGRPWSQLPGG